MTADVELLPLPPHFSHQHDNVKKIVREYAIANMAELADDRDDLLARLDASIDHGTKLGAAQQRCLDEVLEQKAEIERLRAERDSFQRVGIVAQDRAERLAEALRSTKEKLELIASVLGEAIAAHDEMLDEVGYSPFSRRRLDEAAIAVVELHASEVWT